MTDIDPKALEHACQCAGRSVHHFDRMALDLPLRASIVAHARAIEQHEAYKREVSDAIVFALKVYGGHRTALDPLRRFIIPKPDPLVEAWNDMFPRGDCGNCVDVEMLRAALAARGLEVRKIGEGE